MKKLMCALAAVAAGVAMADVKSANVVGYAQHDLNLSGGAIIGSMFETVGVTDGACTFGDIVPVLENGSVAESGNVSVQYLKNTGGTDPNGRYSWTGTNWMNQKTHTDASTETISAGKGMWVLNNAGGSTKIALRSSGEVSKADIIAPLNLSGGALVANSFPVAITFANLLPKLGDGSLAESGNVSIQYLKNTGGTDPNGRYSWTGTNWMNQKTHTDASTETIPAGKGMWVLNNAGGSTPINLYIAAPTSNL